jgi:glycerophosphoryl diester phosphodiesterase
MNAGVVAGFFGVWVLAVLTIILAPVLFPAPLEEFVGRGAPRQYYSGLAAEILANYRGVQGVSHNSGNSAQTAREAAKYGADVIEIDVLNVNGRLYASHDGPSPILGTRVFPRPRLEQMWRETEGSAVLLDLKEPSSSYRGILLDFLEANAGGRQITVSSRSSWTLEEFKRRLPGATRLLSVGSSSGLEVLAREEELLRTIDGVTIREGLLDEDTVAWLKSNGLVVYAWVVNGFDRLNELVEWGVDGIVTDNLAILELLGDRGPLRLPDRDIDTTGGAESVWTPERVIAL